MQNKKIIAFFIAVTVFTVGFVAYRNHGKSNTVTYREVPVKRADLDSTVLSTGTVEPQNRLAIKPPVAGRVEQVLVKEGQKVTKGQILAWMSSSERAAMLDAARGDGLEAVKRWEENYKPTPIIAPINGTIILREVETGQTFTSTDAVFTMSDRLIVKAQVDETDIGKVRVGQAVRLNLDAYPESTIPAKVDQIAFDAQTVNNVTTYVVDILPSETPAFMRSGMTVNVHFEIESRKNSLVVPTEALKRNEGKSQLLVKNASSPLPQLIDVELGLSDGKRTEVLSGINEGDVVLIEQKVDTSKEASGTNPFMPKGPSRSGRNR